MWVVTLHFNDGYGKSQYKEICGCETEGSAHRAGSRAAAYYNGGLSEDLLAGVIDCHWQLPRDHYTYSVKEHKGEWI